MKRFSPALPPLALAGLLLAAPAHAQDRTAEVDSIFSSITAENPGCAVGASLNGNVVVNRAFGLADVERRIALTPASAFDIGSVQKQFVAAAILLLVEDGRLALDDDIRKHVPELPDYGHTVTLNHLLTHTGGLRDWTGLLPLAPEGTDVLELILRQRSLNFAPGEEWSYSNSGYVLLKEIVGRASGLSFAEFARTRIFEPLGMTSSAYVADILQGSGELALAYQKDGDGWTRYMRLGNERGGGAVISTARDLLTWNDALTNARLGRFVTDRLQERARLNNGRTLSYARGLMVNDIPGGPMISHSGGAAGYSTWLGRFPTHGVSVAVMCNFEPVSATSLAGRVADLFLPPVDRESPPGPVAVDGVDVSGRGGLFFEERTGAPLRLVVNGERLAVAGGPPLVPLSAASFRMPHRSPFFRSEDDVEFTFRSADELELRSMEGDVVRYRRAPRWTPSAADLRAASGRYESDELGTVFEILPGEKGIVVRFERAPEKSQELEPVAPDTYMLRMAIVRLRRDANGTVTGFDYGNPVVRSLAFTRRGDLAASAPPAAPAAANAAPAAPPAEPAPALEGLVGEYEMAPGRSITITLEGGQLHGEPTGSPKRPLVHLAGATFAVGEAGAPMTLTFTLGDDGRASALVMRRNGNERTLPRVR